MTAPTMPWSEMDARQKEAAVLPLATRGLSAKQIADRLGLDSRNRVITVLARLRKAKTLAPATRQGRSSVARNRVDAPAKAKAPKRSKETTGSWGGAVGRVQAKLRRQEADQVKAKSAPVLVISRAAAFDPIPGQIPAAFADNHGCRWPVDGIDGPGLLACGAAKEPEHVYCADHRRLAYVPRVPRQKAASRAAERLS